MPWGDAPFGGGLTTERSLLTLHRSSGFRAPIVPVLMACLLGLGFLGTQPSAVDAQETMTFRAAGSGGNCSFCLWVAGEGRIAPATVDALQELAADGEYGNELFYLHSPGGDVDAAMAMGRIFRRIGAGVWVAASTPEENEVGPATDFTSPGVCEGACILALVGAVERHGSELSLGSVAFGDLPGEIARAASAGGMREDIYLARVVLPYLLQMGADPELLVRAYERPGADPLAEVELFELGIFLASGFGRWTLSRTGGSLSASTRDQNLRERIQSLELNCGDSGGVEMTVRAHRSGAYVEFRSAGRVSVGVGTRSWLFGHSSMSALSGTDRTVMVRFPVPVDMLHAMSDEEVYSVGFQVSNAAGYTQSRGTSTVEDRAVIGAVVRSCVQPRPA